MAGLVVAADADEPAWVAEEDVEAGGEEAEDVIGGGEEDEDVAGGGEEGEEEELPPAGAEPIVPPVAPPGGVSELPVKLLAALWKDANDSDS